MPFKMAPNLVVFSAKYGPRWKYAVPNPAGHVLKCGADRILVSCSNGTAKRKAAIEVARTSLDACAKDEATNIAPDKRDTHR